MGDGSVYHMLTVNGAAVAGVMATDTDEMRNVPPHWSTYLAVDDVDTRVARCIELGATVVVPPIDVPGVGRMALVCDPQGAHIWLFRSANQ